MRLTKVVFSILALSFTGCGGGLSSVKNGTPQEAIETLFMTIRNNDPETFQNLLVKKEDLVSWAQKSADPDQVVSDRLQVLKPDSFMVEQFHGVRSDGNANGIEDWDELIFKRAIYSHANYSKLERVNYCEAEFTYRDYIGRIKFGALIKSHRGWVLEPYYRIIEHEAVKILDVITLLSRNNPEGSDTNVGQSVQIKSHWENHLLNNRLPFYFGRRPCYSFLYRQYGCLVTAHTNTFTNFKVIRLASLVNFECNKQTSSYKIFPCFFRIFQILADICM